MTLVVGLMGPAGSGKSTVAAYLAKRYSGVIYSFARPLKEMVRRAFDLSHEQVYGTQDQKEKTDLRYGVSPRWLLQRIGTDGCRAVFGENFWAERCLTQISRDRPALAIIEDVRFINEAVAIHEAREVDGWVWRLECPDRQTAEVSSAHASETDWARAPYDRVVSAKISEGAQALLAAVDRTVESMPSFRAALKMGA